jgi:hypothetical protein
MKEKGCLQERLCLLPEDIAMKTIYLRVAAAANRAWSRGTFRRPCKCSGEIMEMFQKRYP